MRKSALVLLILLSAFATRVGASSCPVDVICAPALLGQLAIDEETDGFSIHIKYPVLCAPESTMAIRNHVTRALADFKADFPEHDLSDYRHKHEMMTEFAIWEAGDGRYASVKLQVMIYTGGAHPNHWPVTWVFDLETDTSLALDDIFSDVKVTLAAIAPMVRTALLQSLGNMAHPGMLDDGTRPVMGNYDGFIINDEGIAFFFAPYRVAPYAAGQQVVTIPWTAIQSHLKPEFGETIR